MRARRAAALAAAALAVAACSSGSPAGGDLPASKLSHNDDVRTVYDDPEDFPNVVSFCDGTTRIYTTTDKKVLLVTDAVQCGGQGRGGLVWGPPG